MDDAPTEEAVTERRQIGVRRATEADLEAVSRLTLEAYRDEGFISPESPYIDHLADAATRAREAELWVAVDGDDVIGSVAFCPVGSPFAELARGNEGEFRMLGVAARARRRGAARALVVHCIERSRQLGYDALVMWTMGDMVAAHRLYDSLGFRRIPERDWSPADGVHLLAFSLPLP